MSTNVCTCRLPQSSNGNATVSLRNPTPANMDKLMGFRPNYILISGRTSGNFHNNWGCLNSINHPESITILHPYTCPVTISSILPTHDYMWDIVGSRNCILLNPIQSISTVEKKHCLCQPQKTSYPASARECKIHHLDDNFMVDNRLHISYLWNKTNIKIYLFYPM